MRKLIILLILTVAAAFALQKYTDFKAVDLAQGYWQRIDWVHWKNVISSQLGLTPSPTPNPDLRLNVFIRENGFVPNSNVLKKGAKVNWYNEDTRTHTVSGNGWGSGEIKPDGFFSKTFDLPGEYSYRCSLHPSEEGKIIIAE